tara:strand:+ start:10033 stop:10317 length:285 start_codon:yes stop_codon:yes gene_type:complete
MVALTPYKYNWCVGPSIRLTCRIRYEPFVAHGVTQERYEYTIAVWEREQSVPSLFRKLSKYGVIALDHNKPVDSHDGVMLYALPLSLRDEAAKE